MRFPITSTLLLSSLLFCAIFQANTCQGKNNKETNPSINSYELSKIENFPTIGSGKYVKNENLQHLSTSKPAQIPTSFWILFLLSYTALISFNLFYRIEKQKEPRWKWEASLTSLFLIIWSVFDVEGLNSWMPYSIIISGVIIYIFYLFILKKEVCKTCNF